MVSVFSFPKVFSHPQLPLPLEICFAVTLGKALNSYPIPACKIGRWYHTTFFFKWCTQRRCFPSSGLPKLVILAWGTSSVTMQREITWFRCSVKPLVLPANCKWWWVTALILSSVLLPNPAKHFTHKATGESLFFSFSSLVFFQMIQYCCWVVEERVRMWLENFGLHS